MRKRKADDDTAKQDNNAISGEIDESTEGADSGSAKRVRTVLSTAPSFVLVDTGAPHPDLPGIKVRLRPYVAVKDGKIDKIAISGRTPSPFGRAMGDHTVAWQIVVDEVHALLHGRSIDGAVEELRRAHVRVSGWMQARGTPGKLLLRELDNMASRWQRLEDATYHTNRCLNGVALAADEATRRSQLGLAIAYHLAYLNYLPFETVPAKSARGSHGSAEGRHRRVLVEYELERRKARLAAEEAAKATHNMMEIDEERDRVEAEKAAAEEVAAEERRRELVRPALLTAMWSMLDLAAAVRESDLEYVLRPKDADKPVEQNAEIVRLATELMDIAGGLLAKGTADLDTGEQLKRIEEEADTIAGAAEYKAITSAAGLVKTIASETYSSLGTPAKNRSAANKAVDNKMLGPKLEDSAQVAAEIARMSARAPERAARVLAVVFPRHLTALAAAYPNSVTDSGLLEPKPAEVAWARLMTWLGASEFADDLPGSTDALDSLKRAFITEFGIEPIEIGRNVAWVVNAGNPGLVVTWNPDKSKMEVNGRAAAPEGVAGMGSHTTAWVVECDALNAIIAGALSDDDRVAKLRAAVEEDLQGSVIRLVELLPADQLEGSQLRDLFQAAADVLTAANHEDAARSYLEFRNLLPFATVDEGDRGGHAEGSDTSLKGRFDADALAVATENVADALKDVKRVEALAVVMEAAASQLKAEAMKTDPKDKKKKRWPLVVREAAQASAKRLASRSAKLAQQAADDEIDAEAADKAAKRIYDVRWKEHTLVYEQAYHPS